MFATTGNYISPKEHAIVAEIYRLYGERIKVQKFEHRELLVVIKHPYRIMQWVQSETHPDGGFYEPLFGVNHLDERVLFQLNQMDDYKGWRALAILDKWEEDEEKRLAQEETDWQEEAQKLIASAFSGTKSFSFRAPGSEKLVKLQ